MLHSRPSNSETARKRFLTCAVIISLAGITALAVVWNPLTSSSAAGKQTEKRILRNGRHQAGARPAPSTNLGADSVRLTAAAALVGSVTVDRTDDPSGVALTAASACTVAPNDCSLRGAVGFADLNAGTTINVPAGTYNLVIPGGFVEFLSGDDTLGDLDITASGTSIVGAGAATTIIHQTQAGDRVIEINPFLDAAFITSISGVTISGGSETTGVGGGGILSGSIDNATTLTNCVVSGNSAPGSPGGGGIQNFGGALNISGCTFSNNSTDASGGAVQYSAGDPAGRNPSVGTLAISGSTFSSNTATSTGVGGGALDLFDFNLSVGTYLVSTSSFNSNHATGGSGGAIIVESGGPLTVTTSSFANNNAANFGGAILAGGTVGSVRYSRLAGNSVPTAANGLTIFNGSGTFTADDNWWGINTGPGANHFRNSAGTAVVASYLQLRASGNPNSICTGASSTISADIKQRNVGAPLTVELNGLPPFPATFVNATPALGTLSGASANFVDGAASATFTASGGTGTANIDVTADSQTVTASISIGSNSTSDPADQSVCAGGTATFSTTASGPGPITFTWKKGATVLNNGDLGGRASIVSGPTSSTLTIINVQASDADTYTVEAAGACSTATQSATLTVNSPTTTTDPPDQTVCAGAMANFSTTAGGTGPFTYSWTLDGNPYNGNSASISIDTTGMSGTHTVSVTTTGACNSASQSATLTVNSSTTTTDPPDQTVCQGAMANFSTTAGGTGPFSYAWTLDGNPTGGNSASVSIDTSSLSGNHTVSVTTTGACGSASQSATLTVNTPTTTTDPPDQTVCQGAMANFSTTAGGTGPFSYAWTLDGNPYNGNSASISIDTTGMSGTHTVSVTTTGACNSASQSATLTVNTPTTTTDPPDQTVCEGATASFSTTAGGTGPFSYAWTVDGSPSGGNSSSINVNTTGFSAGNHTVSVTTTGACGSASQSATLTVQATTTTTDPPDQTVCQGAMANFSTTAGGTGPFSYAWTLDGNSYNGNSASISIDTTSLSVGNHTVAVTTTGTCGTASQSATLTVRATTTTTDPADQSVCEGATANFSTTAGGTGPFSYAWTLDGNPYNGNSPSISVNTTGFSQGAHTVTVTTTGACGSASQSATLNVNNGTPTITVANSMISVWPPNHQYQNFTLSDFGVTASSACDGDLTNSVVIVSVTSDELDNNPGGADGSTINDIVIAADCKSVDLRRERDGGLDGRVYTITFKVTDSVGHTSTATATVTVPINQNGGGAVNSGVQNTVNGTCP